MKLRAQEDEKRKKEELDALLIKEQSLKTQRLEELQKEQMVRLLEESKKKKLEEAERIRKQEEEMNKNDDEENDRNPQKRERRSKLLTKEDLAKMSEENENFEQSRNAILGFVNTFSIEVIPPTKKEENTFNKSMTKSFLKQKTNMSMARQLTKAPSQILEEFSSNQDPPYSGSEKFEEPVPENTFKLPIVPETRFIQDSSQFKLLFCAGIKK